MTRILRSMVAGGALFAALACGTEQPADTDVTDVTPPAQTPKAPRVDGLVPGRVSVEGGEEGTVYGARFCVRALLRIGGELVPLKTKSDDTLTFVFPPAKKLDSTSTEDLAVECPDGTATLAGAVTFDPALVVKPEVASYGPLGTVQDAKAPVKVTFNRAMDAESIAGHVGVEGVPGTLAWDAATRTATFTPAQPLLPRRSYVGFVTGGTMGVRSTFGDALPADLRWQFQTSAAPGTPLP